MAELLAGALFASAASGVGLAASASKGISASTNLACASGSMVSKGVSASGTSVANCISTSGATVSRVGTASATSTVDASKSVTNSIGTAASTSGAGVSRASGGIGGKVSQISVQTGITAINESQKLKQRLAELRAECPNPFVEHNQLNANTCDIIEFMREMYSHFGICIGNGYIAHFFQPEGSATYLYRSDLIEAVANGSKCRVNNLEAGARRRGASLLEAGQILGKALSKLNSPGVYHLLDNNCETFVTECRYGLGFSEQSSAVEDKPLLKTAANIVGGAMTE